MLEKARYSGGTLSLTIRFDPNFSNRHSGLSVNLPMNSKPYMNTLEDLLYNANIGEKAIISLQVDRHGGLWAQTESAHWSVSINGMPLLHESYGFEVARSQRQRLFEGDKVELWRFPS